jgi:hypothetical protein
MSRRRAERMGFVLEGDDDGEEDDDDDDDDDGEGEESTRRRWPMRAPRSWPR